MKTYMGILKASIHHFNKAFDKEINTRDINSNGVINITYVIYRMKPFKFYEMSHTTRLYNLFLWKVSKMSITFSKKIS